MERHYRTWPFNRSGWTFHPLSTAESLEKEEGTPATERRSLVAWIGAIWALVTFFLFSIGVTIFVLIYVADHHFNLTERTPLVKTIGGVQAAPFIPLQSDIVTFLSSIIAVLKCALAAWAGLLCWNAALFLMERRGLARRDLKTLLSYGLLTPGTYSKDWVTYIIGALLLASLVANLSSPILTGSISWVPSSRLVHSLSAPILFADVVDGTLTHLSKSYNAEPNVREGYIMSAVGRIGIGWGRDTDKGVVKRVSQRIATVTVNSTFENATLPYFQVHSIRWIEDRNEIPGIRDGLTPTEILHPHFAAAPSTVSSYPAGYAILVPNVITNWSSDPLDSTIIHETRLLILYYAWEDNSSGHYNIITQDLPSSAYTLKRRKHYYTFAWVIFSAGVGKCKAFNCIVSSPSTIRNNTPIEIEPHQLTFQALSLAPVIAVHLVQQNISLPFPWENINDYVEGILVRSYSGAWNNINSNIPTLATETTFIPAVPSLLADVDLPRVYIWLGIQLLVTILSVLFLVIRDRLSEYPLVDDTTLSAFDLDTTCIPKDNEAPVTKELRKIEKQGNRLIIKAE